MFSQYTWWDFAKFCLALAIPYYAYVIWKYYRQDIREWISSRGEDPHPQTTAVDDEEEDTNAQPLYRVNTYGNPTTKPAVVSPQTQTAAKPNAGTLNQSTGEADLSDGYVLTNEDVTGMDLAFVADVEIHQERSLDEILDAAKGLTVDDKGVVTPVDSSDEKAGRLAQIVNSQQGNVVFADMPFKR